MTTDELPSFGDVQAAAGRLLGRATRTPLLQNRFLNEDSKREVFLKPEMLQHSGSFKFRGAYNRISQLTPEERKSGVIAWSSGNHAQGVAAAAKLEGLRARIVMPEDAPRIKLDNTRALGAEVITYDRYSEDREAISYALAERDGGVIVPSFDDAHVIAGQGTAGLEIFEDAAKEGRALDALLICCGGGGLTAGCALAAETLSPDTALFTVEPAHYDDHARSLMSGQRERADTSQPSLCDALLSPTPGVMTFSINQRLLTGGLVVTESEVKAAMRYAFRVLKLVVEPGGAVALAALLSGKLDPRYQSVAIMLSGGNVDPRVFADVLGEAR
ncbi:threonine ammonia-lyase [Congregibacter litoralis]|uniref:L-threonine ammonia-lyase n=1 Tax=Congregibacter litoralis KT71 TaxID=314285 RepID=A4AD82_9GAMM|nr:threonine/serine dehydratase [Congregibacter litoralis]EAQ96006.1 L-threonine ammonia-lyase [Congregibacter litoralis KT71]